MGFRLWGRTESDTTEATEHTHAEEAAAAPRPWGSQQPWPQETTLPPRKRGGGASQAGRWSLQRLTGRAPGPGRCDQRPARPPVPPAEADRRRLLAPPPQEALQPDGRRQKPKAGRPLAQKDSAAQPAREVSWASLVV